MPLIDPERENLDPGTEKITRDQKSAYPVISVCCSHPFAFSVSHRSLLLWSLRFTSESCFASPATPCCPFIFPEFFSVGTSSNVVVVATPAGLEQRGRASMEAHPVRRPRARPGKSHARGQGGRGDGQAAVEHARARYKVKT